MALSQTKLKTAPRHLGFHLISIVDDDPWVRAAIRALLRSAGYESETFASAELFLASAAPLKTGCLILDIRMPGIGGLGLQQRLATEGRSIPIIFVTAHDDKSTESRALKAGAFGIFHKPFDGDTFLLTIEAALRTGTRMRNMTRRSDRMDTVFGAEIETIGGSSVDIKSMDLGSDVLHFRGFVEVCVVLLGAESGSLQFCDDQGHMSKFVARVGSHDQAIVHSLSSNISPCNGTVNGTASRTISDKLQSVELIGRDGGFLGILSVQFANTKTTHRKRAVLELCAQQATQLVELHRRERFLRTEVEMESKRADKLQFLNKTLIASNQDLERFAGTASHDLQEPLRTITAYCELLAEHPNLKSETDGNAGMMLGYVLQGAHQMQVLLADLLKLAQVGDPNFESSMEVDLNEVMKTVARSLRIPIQENTASICFPTLPTLRGKEVHFIQLFQNLVANALTYRSESSPQIKISMEQKRKETEFAVSDNGIGIGSEHFQTIFQPFIRLHERERPGTGLGLAICKQIVEHYGGRIWVDSRPHQGSTLYFTVPNALIRN